MVLTPTYYVFRLFMHHQDSELLVSEMITDKAEGSLPVLQASASVDEAGFIHITLVNPGLDEAQDLRIDLSGRKAETVTGEILTGAMDAHNTFDAPDRVHDEPMTAYTIGPDGVRVTLPPVSVVHLAVKLHE